MSALIGCCYILLSLANHEILKKLSTKHCDVAIATTTRGIKTNSSMLYGVYGMSVCLVTVNVFFFYFSIIWNLHLFYRKIALIPKQKVNFAPGGRVRGKFKLKLKQPTADVHGDINTMKKMCRMHSTRQRHVHIHRKRNSTNL